MKAHRFFFILIGIIGSICVSSIAAPSYQSTSSILAQSLGGSSSPASPPISPSQIPSASPNPSEPAKEASPAPSEGASPSVVETSGTPEVATLYSQLGEALTAKRWEDADRITYELMLEISGSKSKTQGFFDSLEWQKFPCEQFKKIDELWGKASDNELGFSAQIKVFREDAGERADDYYKKIEWKSNDGAWTVSWEYDQTAKRYKYTDGKTPNFTNPPAGHLPALLVWNRGVDYRLQKSIACDLYLTP
ncbi:MAG: GUN4 domain-containing protein [Drouetiella hepatica Uher 2000/2452]|uniref:GUN4 domain-containing protein n=1 Tax=Drouetiella hepatica Uher 2000/2452 TaxID=904376 RepID=A0A951UMK6_9CYAN|nr:GUN4 domain-containing protein [Drouetiella hepatica Uher 2000/2452]